MVLGSGFESVASALADVRELAFRDIRGFPAPTVAGHHGRFVCGNLGRVPVVALVGRPHYYEGYSLAAVTFPIRVLAALGIETVLLTNAAGGINRRFRPGQFMMIEDHINLLGENPLRGPVAAGRDRFVDLAAVYDRDLRENLVRAAREAGVRLRRGVYVAVPGPSYETPAEVRALARLGADAVGMSTVPEAIVARQCGLRVVGLSCITNHAAGQTEQPLSHGEVLEAGRRAGPLAVRVLECFVTRRFRHPSDSVKAMGL